MHACINVTVQCIVKLLFNITVWWWSGRKNKFGNLHWVIILLTVVSNFCFRFLQPRWFLYNQLRDICVSSKMELKLEVVLSSSIKRKKPWPRFCWLGQVNIPCLWASGHWPGTILPDYSYWYIRIVRMCSLHPPGEGGCLPVGWQANQWNQHGDWSH